MDELFNWPPIIWAVRVVFLGALLSGAWIGILYACRYFRWSNIKADRIRNGSEDQFDRGVGAKHRAAPRTQR